MDSLLSTTAKVQIDADTRQQSIIHPSIRTRSVQCFGSLSPIDPQPVDVSSMRDVPARPACFQRNDQSSVLHFLSVCCASGQPTLLQQSDKASCSFVQEAGNAAGIPSVSLSHDLSINRLRRPRHKPPNRQSHPPQPYEKEIIP